MSKAMISARYVGLLTQGHKRPGHGKIQGGGGGGGGLHINALQMAPVSQHNDVSILRFRDNIFDEVWQYSNGQLSQQARSGEIFRPLDTKNGNNWSG